MMNISSDLSIWMTFMVVLTTGFVSGLSPCILPITASVFAYTATKSSIALGALLMLCYWAEYSVAGCWYFHWNYKTHTSFLKVSEINRTIEWWGINWFGSVFDLDWMKGKVFLPQGKTKFIG